MRLIDADELITIEIDEADPPFRFVPAEFIEAAPTIDAAPVVRCVDCDCFSKTIYPSGTIIGYCAFNKHPVMPEDYCSCGERKEVNETN